MLIFSMYSFQLIAINSVNILMESHHYYYYYYFLSSRSSFSWETLSDLESFLLSDIPTCVVLHGGLSPLTSTLAIQLHHVWNSPQTAFL